EFLFGLNGAQYDPNVGAWVGSNGQPINPRLQALLSANAFSELPILDKQGQQLAPLTIDEVLGEHGLNANGTAVANLGRNWIQQTTDQTSNSGFFSLGSLKLAGETVLLATDKAIQTFAEMETLGVMT